MSGPTKQHVGDREIPGAGRVFLVAAQRLPLALAGLVLLLPLCLLVLSAANGRMKGRLSGLEGPPLHGMQTPAAAVSWSWPRMLSRDWQRQVEARWNTGLPLRTRVVRATNQVYYSVFGKSYMYEGQLIFGREQQIYEQIYLQKYCNVTHQAYVAEEFAQWAAQLRQVQEYFERRGQTFVFLITPSKASFYPQYLPPRFACPGPWRPDYTLAVAALSQSGVHFVDGSKTVLAAQRGFAPELLFGRGGTHWSTLASALVTRELVRKLAVVKGQRLPDFRFSYSVSLEPGPVETDLLDLANLWYPLRNYPAARLAIERTGGEMRQPLKLAVVGSSFLHQVVQDFWPTGIFSSIDYYYYFSIEHRRLPDTGPAMVETSEHAGVDRAGENYHALLDADLVILEENESNIRSNHLAQLRRQLALDQ